MNNNFFDKIEPGIILAQAKSEGVTARTAITFIDKVSVPAFVPPEDGNYIVDFSCEINIDNGNSVNQVRLRQNDSVELNFHGPEIAGLDLFETMSGVSDILALTVAGGPYRFDLEFASPDEDTARIRRARIFVRKAI